MVIAPLSLKQDYWQNFEVKESDLEFLYNHLLEVEQPQTSEQLLHALVTERIRQERETLEKKQQADGAIYYPKDHYETGQIIQIPAFAFQSGKVTSTRPGHNPEIGAFEVIEVQLASGEKHTLAAMLENHKLNQPISINSDDPLLNLEYVLENYGEDLSAVLAEYLDTNPDLVRIAAKYFPRALLVDINMGHLNLAEAVLDMMGGGPLPTPALMEQIDLAEEKGSHLTEFSLNLALQEDKRFDEVGAAGEVLWFLHRLEPEPVREVPAVLRNSAPIETSPEASAMLREFEPQVLDELEPTLHPASGKPVTEVTITLIYPHWRAGTLPLTGALESLFPTAFESPRIQFTFVDGNSGEKFSGWVVRPFKYVYGLRNWYLAQGVIAGTLLRLSKGKNPGEVIVRTDKKRGAREWIRTAIIASDGGVVFSMLKHNISAAVDERMGIVVSDPEMLDTLWEKNNKARAQLAYTIRQVMTELAKLSPQSHVHAQELYAGVNIFRRCPPGPILTVLLESPWARHLGNLYFRLDESSGGDND
jgi:hypothetical protein